MTRRGSGLVRQLEKVVREGGAEILLRASHDGHHSRGADPHSSTSRSRARHHRGTRRSRYAQHPRALKGVLVATGGHSNNIEFRRIFDARLTDEYRVTGDPYSRKTR